MDSLIQFYGNYLAMLFAIRTWSQGAHHAGHGPTFFADHAFLDEVYSAYAAMYDKAAERARLAGGVALVSPKVVGPAAQAQLDKWPDVSDPAVDVWGTALELVRGHQTRVEEAVKQLRAAGVSTLEFETWLGDQAVQARNFEFLLTGRTAA